MINLDQFAAPTKASVDTLFGLSTQAFESVEKLVALNLQTIKTLLAESHEASQAALLAKSPADLLKLQSEALKAAPQKAAAYGRQVQEILASFAAAQRASLDAQFEDVQAKFTDAVNGVMKDAPGTEQFLTLAKSAAAAAKNAYEGTNKAAKQIADALTANAEQVADAVVKNSKAAVATTEA
ncbi:TIGR01841 family phasin [Variovorax sp. dw_954]|uniref:TIGR01841 family phasin n=1 Tax=Variovorax sp. dw_954 TaxID=2720078 RepID=UPI001BD3C09D|nr:TIGR01841 family phasin [Variovorax sp. dw_954]